MQKWHFGAITEIEYTALVDFFCGIDIGNNFSSTLLLLLLLFILLSYNIIKIVKIPNYQFIAIL